MTDAPPHPLDGKRRIAVYGPSGSGKTTLARRIGAALDLPVVELDALYHQPNWTPTPDDQFRAKVVETLDGLTEGWVVDGNYGMVRPLVLTRADVVVRLRLPFRVVYRRLFWRTMHRSWKREHLWNGNHESFRLALTSRESILLWGITNWRPHRRNLDRALAEHAPHTPVVELRSDREVRALVVGLGRAKRQYCDRKA